jgi:ubiquinone/menaquinone biosynthesis C-methylase UbiE
MEFLDKCRACGSKRYQRVLVKDEYSFCKCSDCGLIFLDAIFSDLEIEKIYSYYSNCRQDFNAITEIRYKELLKKFEKVRSTNNILDVGCGIGHFLNVASLAGWNAYGTEISDEACRIAGQKNKNVHYGELKNIKFQDNHFDVITLFEVLEHVADPSALLQECRRVLRTGGVIYGTTPNYNSLDRFLAGDKWKVYHPEHLSYFDIKSLRFLMEKAGFKIRSLETKNIAVSGIFGTLLLNKKRGDIIDSTHFSEEQIREISEKNKFAKFLKICANSLIKTLKCGQTIYTIAEKV